MEACFVVSATVFLFASDRGHLMRPLSRRSCEAAWALNLPCWCFHLTQLTLKANVTVSSLPFRSILCHGCGYVRTSDTVFFFGLCCAARQRHPVPLWHKMPTSFFVNNFMLVCKVFFWFPDGVSSTFAPLLVFVVT